MARLLYPKSGFDKKGDSSGGISWTNFKRSPGESKNGYFLCRNCGFEIIHVTKTDKKLGGYGGLLWFCEYIESLDQGNTKLENEVDEIEIVRNVLKCKQCQNNVGFHRELKQGDHDTVTVKFLFRTERLVYENDSLTCQCSCDVDKGKYSTTVTYKRHKCLSFSVVLLPIKNENGKFYDVKTFREVINERKCKECHSEFCKPDKIMDICCFDCHALIGLYRKSVSTEENQKPFVGYILQKLNHDEGKGNIYKDPSVAETYDVNDKMTKERPWLTRYSSSGLVRKLTQNTEERNESPTLQVNSTETGDFVKDCYILHQERISLHVPDLA